MSAELALLILLILVLAGGFHDWGRGPLSGSAPFFAWCVLIIALLVIAAVLGQHRLR